MTWLRLQWRGALVALVAWAGLAAAQSSGPQTSPYLPMPAATLPPASAASSQLPPINSVKSMPKLAATPAAPANPPQHVVTLNESGKTIRCRLVQSWLLADGSTAHQLQAISTRELITILDDAAAPRTPGRGLPMRIFHWGLRNQVPPPGVPAPPLPARLATDSGVVMTREINPPPPGASPLPGAMLANGQPSPYSFNVHVPAGTTMISSPATGTGAPVSPAPSLPIVRRRSRHRQGGQRLR